MIALCCCVLANAAIAQEITVVSKPAEVERLTGQLHKTLNELSPAAKIQECSPVVQEYAGSSRRNLRGAKTKSMARFAPYPSSGRTFGFSCGMIGWFGT